MKKSILVAGVLGLLVCAATPAAFAQAAPFSKPEDAIRYRKAAFTLLSAHYGRVAAMASGRAPFDAKAAAANAELAVLFSKLPFDGFVPGSDSGNTKAKPEIWTEQDKFQAAASKMQDAMGQLDAAAKSGSLDAVKTASGAVGQSCKACHDHYRKD